MHKQINKDKIINKITQTKTNKINITTSGHKIPITIRENAPAFAPTNFRQKKKKTCPSKVFFSKFNFPPVIRYK
jgi:hypothetical protein